MNKTEFINEITQPLKNLGYRKKGFYWFRKTGKIILCINVQGSQWNTNNYYVEIGVALDSASRRNPTVLYWYARHRCKGISGELNIEPRELYAELANHHSSICDSVDLSHYLTERNARKVVNQFWF